MRHGKFSGDPRAVWKTEDGTPDRNMELLADFSFEDPDKLSWPAPKGSVIDGASIPRALWSVVGSPYTGDYRRASIVHDVACVIAGANKAKRRKADRMFFHACRAGGCSVWQSIIMYLGVRIGSAMSDVASWRAVAATESSGPKTRRTEDELALERDFQDIAEQVLAAGEVDDPAILEKRADAALLAVVGLRSVSPKKKPPARRAR